MAENELSFQSGDVEPFAKNQQQDLPQNETTVCVQMFGPTPVKKYSDISSVRYRCSPRAHSLYVLISGTGGPPKHGDISSSTIRLTTVRLRRDERKALAVAETPHHSRVCRCRRCCCCRQRGCRPHRWRQRPRMCWTDDAGHGGSSRRRGRKPQAPSCRTAEGSGDASRVGEEESGLGPVRNHGFSGRGLALPRRRPAAS